MTPKPHGLFREALPRYYSDYVVFALWFYRKRKFPLYQVVWPNNEGLYTCNQKASKALKEWQPMLGKISPLHVSHMQIILSHVEDDPAPSRT